MLQEMIPDRSPNDDREEQAEGILSRLPGSIGLLRSIGDFIPRVHGKYQIPAYFNVRRRIWQRKSLYNSKNLTALQAKCYHMTYE